MPNSLDDILDVKQASEFLKLNPQTVRRMLARGELPGRKLGNTWRLSRRQLVTLVESGEREGNEHK